MKTRQQTNDHTHLEILQTGEEFEFDKGIDPMSPFLRNVFSDERLILDSEGTRASVTAAYTEMGNCEPTENSRSKKYVMSGFPQSLMLLTIGRLFGPLPAIG